MHGYLTRWLQVQVLPRVLILKMERKMAFKKVEIVEGELKHIDLEYVINENSRKTSVDLQAQIMSKLGNDVIIKNCTLKEHFNDRSRNFAKIYIYDVSYVETTKTEKIFTKDEVLELFLIDFWKGKSTDKIKYEVDHS